MSDTDTKAMKSGSSEARGWRKAFLGFVVIAAGVFVAWRFGVFDLLTVDNIDRLDGLFDNLGWWAPLAFNLTM